MVGRPGTVTPRPPACPTEGGQRVIPPSKPVLPKPKHLPGLKFKAALEQGCLVPVFGLGI